MAALATESEDLEELFQETDRVLQHICNERISRTKTKIMVFARNNKVTNTTLSGEKVQEFC